MAKKIVIDARMYGLENAGIGRYLVNLIEELKNIDAQERFILLLRKKYYDNLKLPPHWDKVKLDATHYTISEQLLLPITLLKIKPDLVHFPHLNIPLFWTGKFIVTVHDLTMQKQGKSATRLPLPLYYAKRIPFLLTARRAVKQSVKIVTPTNFVKKDVVNYYSVEAEKIAVINEGVSAFSVKTDVNNYTFKIPYFLYVGNAYPHKNLARLIEAVIYINEKENKKALIVIAGSTDFFKKRLQKLVHDQKAELYVKLTGFVSDNDLSQLYKNSVAFVYPSLSEGFGLPGLEAMAAGTLVLASDISVFKEIYGKHATYFNPYDFTTIVKAMNSALDVERSERNKKITLSQIFILKYSWAKMAKETVEVYRKALELG